MLLIASTETNNSPSAPFQQKIFPFYISLQEVDEDQYNNVTQELISNEQNVLLNPTIAGDSPQREFELDDVYPYIKTGIASIIEDEVTQRFVAEELKVLANNSILRSERARMPYLIT